MPAFLATLLTFLALGLFLLVQYPLKGYPFPIGWDPPWYIWRVNAVPFDGLARLGTIRAASPLLLTVLARGTGQNAFTMVAIAPAVFAAIAGLGAAAMLRAALGVRAIWVPIIGSLTWFAFGRMGIVGGHLDNGLNAAFVLGGFAAAVGLAAEGKGMFAAAVLFMAAALAEWPFYAFAMAVFLLAVAIFAWPVISARLAGRAEPFGPVGPLLGAAALSLGLTGLSFLSSPPGGGIGLRRYSSGFKALIERRFYERLRQSARYYAFPLAAIGAIAVIRAPTTPSHRPAKRFFLCLMAAWIVVTVMASLAQVAHLPVAGGRLLSFFFAIPILAATFTWWAGRTLASRYGRRAKVAGLAVVCLTVLGFATLAWGGQDAQRPFITGNAVRQAATAGDYIGRFAPHRKVSFLQSGARPWNITLASLPADVVARATRFTGSPDEFLAGATEARSGANGQVEEGPIGIVLRSMNADRFNNALAGHPENLVAPGVIALSGPVLDRPLPLHPLIRANTRGRALLWIGLLIVAYLFLAGTGWAIAMLPSDPILRVTLAPGMGAAMVTLIALAWERLGIGLGGQAAWGPVIVTIASGWVCAYVATLRRRGQASQSSPRDRTRAALSLPDLEQSGRTP